MLASLSYERSLELLLIIYDDDDAMLQCPMCPPLSSQWYIDCVLSLLQSNRFEVSSSAKSIGCDYTSCLMLLWLVSVQRKASQLNAA